MKVIPPFSEPHLEAIANVLADTSSGLTGSEIRDLLLACRIPDIDPENTKRIRLYNAFATEQNKRQYGNHVIAFIHKSMNPVKYSAEAEYFETKRNELNTVLAFSGLAVGEDGKVRRVRKATTIRDAQERADALRTALRSRQVHEDVLRFCKAELLQQNHFHAVLEATKSVADKIRSMTGLTTDGAELATEAFGQGSSGPRLAINPLSNETERGEQRGFTNLLVGLFGTFRNPPAHAPKIYWPIDQADALDILSLLSLVHRKIDQARSV